MNIFQTNEFWYFLIPVLITFILYYKDKSTRDERKHISIAFKANQILSKRIQENLSKFIEDYNAYNTIANSDENITFGTYLEILKEEYNKNLTDEVYQSLLNLKLPKPTLQSMIDSLNKQTDALIEVETKMNIMLKKGKDNNFFVI